MNRGYVKLYRKIEDCSLWTVDEAYCKKAAWVDLIMMANHEDNSFILGMTKIKIKRGQRWTSIEKLASKWKWSIKKVDRFLDLLESEGMIYRSATNKGTLITLVKYDVYQGQKEKSDKPMTEQMTEQKKNKGKTTDRANDRQTIMNKNDIKNELKMNNNKPSAFEDF